MFFPVISSQSICDDQRHVRGVSVGQYMGAIEDMHPCGGLVTSTRENNNMYSMHRQGALDVDVLILFLGPRMLSKKQNEILTWQRENNNEKVTSQRPVHENLICGPSW